MDIQKTLDWLAEVSAQAFDEARGGNTALLHRIGSNPALSYYMNNVHATHSISAEQYAEQAPGYVQEAERFRLEYETMAALPEDHKRLNTVEAELSALKGQLAEALAALKGKTSDLPEVLKPVAKKPVVKPTDAVEAEVDGESET